MTSQNQQNIDHMVKTMQGIEERFESPTMCAAKWLQTTILLYNGHTHSCHHPPAHKIPLDELAENPSALHNTSRKKSARQQMLNGQRPVECQYCWTIEDLPGHHMSDRTYKSTDTHWSVPYLDRITDAGDVDPSYVEVAFDTTCNFKCAYCSPDVSSKWMEEVEQFGQYPVSTGFGDVEYMHKIGRTPIPQRENNPYTNAFWEWWPTVRDKIQTFRITGGEPLLSKHTWRLFDDIDANPRPDMTLAVNTNMGVPEQFIAKLIEYHKRLSPKLKQFDIFTSAEATGKQADYIRFGMSYPLFMQNVRRVLRETTAVVNFMTTVNALCYSTFDKFMMDLYDLRCQFNPADSYNRVPMMVNHLRWPLYMDMRVIPLAIRRESAERFKATVAAHTRVTSDNRHGRFYLEEVDQIERLAEFMVKDLPNAEIYRHDFAKFFIEYDRRRGTNFKQTFPELADFIDHYA